MLPAVSCRPGSSFPSLLASGGRSCHLRWMVMVTGSSLEWCDCALACSCRSLDKRVCAQALRDPCGRLWLPVVELRFCSQPLAGDDDDNRREAKRQCFRRRGCCGCAKSRASCALTGFEQFGKMQKGLKSTSWPSRLSRQMDEVGGS